MRFRGEIRPINLAVQAANGSTINALGLRTCDIQIGGVSRQTELIVAIDISLDLIMGMDLLTTHPDSKQYIAGLYDSVIQGTKKIIDSSFKETLEKLRNYELGRLSSTCLSSLGTTKVLAHVIRVAGSEPIKQQANPVSLPARVQATYHRNDIIWDDS